MLYSTGNSTQYSVMIYMGKENKKEWIYVCGYMDSKEIKPINLKGNQPWLFIGKTDAEAEAPILWPPDVTSQLIGKDPEAGKDWKQEEKGEREDVMVGWHHQLNGHEFEPTLGCSEGQGSLAWGSSCSLKEWGTTQWLNNNNNNWITLLYTWN